MRSYRIFASLAFAAACSSTSPPRAPATAVPAKEPIPTAMKPHEDFAQRCSGDLEAARAKVAQARDAKERTVAAVAQPYNDALILLRDVSARAELFREVHPDAEMRAAADECTKQQEQ